MDTLIKIILCTAFLLSCKKEDIKTDIKTTGIEFYLPENATNIAECKDFDFNTPKLQASPIITNEDVISYNWKQHSITMSERAYNELKSNRNKTRPIYPLILSLNGERIYGLFYKYAILSSSCQSTLISETNFGPTNGKLEYVIVHGQGFDASNLGKDPRGDKRIYDYLRSTGRLVE
jgi:hypothetical protein